MVRGCLAIKAAVDERQRLELPMAVSAFPSLRFRTEVNQEVLLAVVRQQA